MEELQFTVDLKVVVKERDGFYAASVDKLPVLVYGDTPFLAMQKAVESACLLLDRKDDMKKYLSEKGVPHTRVEAEPSTELSMRAPHQVPYSLFRSYRDLLHADEVPYEIKVPVNA